MTKDIGDKAKQGLLWLSIFNSFEFVIRFGCQIILSRILFPEDFGLMGIVSIVTHFARNTASFGFNQALIQLKKIKKEHYDTVFLVNFGIMATVTVTLFFTAPYIASFFKDTRLTPMIMVVSFDFVLRSLILVPKAKLNRKMKYREILFLNTLGNIVNLASPIIFAIQGFGVWSLVWGHMLSTLTGVIGFHYFCPTVPKFHFKMSALKEIMSFSIWNSINKNIIYLIDNIDKIVIAKWLDVTQLGLYERAHNLRKIPSRQIIRKINVVLFPAYSRMQDDEQRTKNALLKVIKYATFASYPLMVWMFFVAPSFVTTAYGPKWQELIIPLQIMCISGIIIPLSQIFNPILLARGWVRQRVIIQSIYLAVLVGAIFYSLRWGIVGVSWATTLSSTVLLTLTAGYTLKKLSMKVIQPFNAQKSPLIYGTIQVIALLILGVAAAPFFSIQSWQMLISVSVVSVLSYLGSHLVFRFEDIDDIYQEFIGEFKKFGARLPVLKQLRFFAN